MEAQRVDLEGARAARLIENSRLNFTGSMGVARTDVRAAALPLGKVLVVGGFNSNGYLATAEVYDSATGLWSPTGSMATTRRFHAVTELPDGKVLVTGGEWTGSSTAGLASAEVYNPDTGTWNPAGSMATTRLQHAATPLQDGKVLITGGASLTNAEVYDPVTSGWHQTNPMSTIRSSHTATRLQNGKVLVVGGQNSNGVLASAEVYTPATETWSPTSSMATARHSHTATLLPDGKVLVTGGSSTSGVVSTAEVYDPGTGVWSSAGSLAEGRVAHTAARLLSGKVLIMGGASSSGALASVEMYEPGTGWSLVKPLTAARWWHAATVFPSGQVLVVGGGTSTNYLSSAEVYRTPNAPMVWAPANGSTISDSTPTYSGTTETGSTVSVIVDGTSVGTATVNGGNWSFTPATPLQDGPHTVKATATDAVGYTSPDSNTASFTVDTTAPAAPVVTSPTQGWVTNDSTPTYIGTTEAGSSVVVIVDGSPVGNATVVSGSWSFTPTAALAEGTHSVNATATDAAGNTSPESSAKSFIVDVTAPAAPVLVSPAHGSNTSDSTPTYSGTAEAFSNVFVFIDSSAFFLTADMAGNWSMTPSAPLGDGTHMVKAKATDAAGNTGADSLTHTFFIDTVPPAAPVVVTPANSSVTNDNTPVYSGTAEAGSTVALVVDGTVLGSSPADLSGNWSFTQPAALTEGPHSVKARATDTTGNTSPDSNTNAFTVDTVAPAAPVIDTPADGSATPDNTPTCGGSAEAGSSVTLIVDGATVGMASANGAGRWSVTPASPWSDGPHSVKAKATDVAGNISADSNIRVLMVDTTPPNAPVVRAPANGSTQFDSTPSYRGTAEVGSTVTVIVDGTAVGTTQAATGIWSLTTTTALAEGPHSVKAQATDATGHTSGDSFTNTFTVNMDPSTGGWTNTGSLSTARSHHTATVLPSGQVLVTGGKDSSGSLQSAELYDPGLGGWIPTSAPGTARSDHAATVLPSGQVLVTGGFNASDGALASAEVYDPDTDVWRVTGTLSTARSWHTATVLPLGQVLVIGGEDSSGSLASTEVYEPDSGTWSPACPLATPRSGHTATVLVPSGKLLIIGGYNPTDGYLASAEVYDPATGTWSATGSMTMGRRWHTATVLPSGKVLVVGGEGASGPLASAELYDPASGSWSPTGELISARQNHSAALLPSGRVLVAGSDDPSGALASVEVYTPSTGIWSPVGTLASARSSHTATVLPSGQVLLTGGEGSSGSLSSAELFGALGAASPVPPLAEARADAMAVLLQDGQVLVVGGASTGGSLDSAQIFDPATGEWTDIAGLGEARASATATLLPSGEVLVAGGRGERGHGLRALDSDTVLQTAELFSPVTKTWRSTGSLHAPRHSHSAILLSDGKVMVMGGVNKEGASLPTVEVYDPDKGTWAKTSPMRVARQRHMVARLPTGKVLAVGGVDEHGTPLSSAEVYDPSTGDWTKTDSMSTARVTSTAALLPTSEVLVVGGSDGIQALDSAEIYDPDQRKWTGVARLHKAREAHSALLLPTGRVLIIGGSNKDTALSDVELYDPVSKQWEEMHRVTEPRQGSISVLLATGQVLVVAGRNASGPAANAELYEEYGAPRARRPVLEEQRPQKPKARIQVKGTGLRGPEGARPRVRLQTVPEGRLINLEADGFSDTSVQVSLPTAPDGTHLLFVLVNDIAGGLALKVDGTPPAAPTVSAPADFVNTPQLELGGTAEPDSTVQVSLDGHPAGEATANIQGSWSLSLKQVLGDGEHTLSVLAMDAAGNLSGNFTRTVTVDTQAPGAPKVTPPAAFFKTPRPLLSGTAEPGSRVTVYVDKVAKGTAMVDTEGMWSFTVPQALSDGLHIALAIATDSAGNTGPSSAVVGFSVDTQAPAAPEVLTPEQGAMLSGSLLTASGTAEPGSVVTVSVDGEVQGTATAGATGAWSLNIPSELKSGEHTLSATAKDAAGNISPPSKARGFAVAGSEGPNGSGGMGCAASPGDPSLVLLGLAGLGQLVARRRRRHA